MIYIPYFIFSYTCGSAREFKKSDGSHVASESMTCQVIDDECNKLQCHGAMMILIPDVLM